jgi:hypothetical protein
MYEKPSLTPVGTAENVIRGVNLVGYDQDTLYVIPGMEFQDELNTVWAEK